ncbi:MAG: hypothetical protein LBL81_01725 [Tannerella sp.]|jgi:lipopolysaccharide export system protein LptA|nr:hypothetical protein [Tannerella sp.]
MKLLRLLLWVSLVGCPFAQAEGQQQDSVPKKQTTHVFLEHADSLNFDKRFNPDVQVLKGHVAFRHDSTFMYCDSAYFFQNSNSLEAFDHVRMEQGDTLFIFSHWLHYDGNTRLARLRDSVRMENRQVRLYTDSLNYDRNANIGYYFNGGRIVDEENTLLSVYGQYSPETKQAVFNDSVKLINPKFTLSSDTLHYDTETKIATILGPSTIVSDSGTVHTSRGWYDTAKDVSLLLDRSEVVSGNRFLTGDSISYDKAHDFSEVFGNMVLRDTAQKIILKGQYGYYDGKKEFAFATDSALLVEYAQGDSLFLHADTLQMSTFDSTYRRVKAYYGVRFFRTDVQGVCDSMLFNTRDSVLGLYKDPVVWNQSYQLYGDTILVFMNDTAADHARIYPTAFAAQQLDTAYYDQLKGNEMMAYFQGQSLRKVDVNGNAESIFYPIDKGGMIGLNHTKSPYLSIWLKDDKLERIKLWPSSEGSLTPIPDLKPADKTLDGFFWLDYLRPKNRYDIYHWIKRKAGNIPKKSDKFVF